ncbi:hypothetical protein N7456_006609 [Penicillium angulare]|uniref:Uncharacterized protein n=1 Tax=Penicillium angulare TaxID=116970 RepID=A0A9W9FI13_9EURO|nr:hypothetical protein N7456_006609 [Penicillium angulare]
MIDLFLQVRHLSSVMGKAHATIHWSARVDAYNIEFVFGSDLDTRCQRNFYLELNLNPEELASAPITDVEPLINDYSNACKARLKIIDFILCSI